jgi:hypothetical protein
MLNRLIKTFLTYLGRRRMQRLQSVERSQLERLQDERSFLN